MTLQAATDTTCNTCRKPILNRRSSLQTKCAPCVHKAANARDKELRKAQRQATIDARKKDAADTRARRVALKSRRDWMDDAQKAFNAWVRARDAHLPCICCGQWGTASDDTPGGKWDAGHFLSRGAYPELRFTPDNCHRQLKSCNAGSSKYAAKGRTVAQGYRIGLIARIGLERVEALEGPHPPAKFSVDELKTIRDGYRLLTKQLTERQRETQELEPASAPPAPESACELATDAPRHPKSTSEAAPMAPASPELQR